MSVNEFLNIHLTHVQLFICCAVIMFLCFVGTVFVFVKFLLKAIAQTNVKNEKNEKKELMDNHIQKKNSQEEVNLKKALLLILGISCVFGVINWFSDSIPTIFNASSKLGISSSLFFLLIAGVGMFLVIFYIPYNVLKIVMKNAVVESASDGKKRKKK